MAQNTASVTASRNTVPGTANEEPVAPPLFTGAPRREYTPDAKRMKEPLATPELARARALFDEGNFAGARAEAKRVRRSKEASREARMEAGDLLEWAAKVLGITIEIVTRPAEQVGFQVQPRRWV